MEFVDSTKGGATATQEESLLASAARPATQLLWRTERALSVNVGPNSRTLKLLKRGFPDAVTWNIGSDKGPSIRTLAGSGHVCLEAGLIGKPLTLPPSASTPQARHSSPA